MGDDDGQQQEIQKRILQQTLSGLSASKDGAESVEVCCVICLSEISEACTARPCAHRNFDFLCLASWLQLKTTCPLCKCEVSEIHYDFSGDGKSYKTFKVPKIGLERSAAGVDARVGRGAESAADTASAIRRHMRGRSRLGSNRPLPVSSVPELRARGVLARRRHVYRNRLYSLHVGSSSVSRYRDVSPQHFNTDPELLSRARAWIRRELQVFEFLSDESLENGRRRRQNHAEFVLEYVIAILKTVDIQESSGHAEELLSDFLGRDNCRVFLHELRSFLRSPFSMDAWDRHVQYDESRATALASGDAGRNQRHVGDRYRPSERRLHQHGNWQHRSGGSSRGDRWRPRGAQNG